MNDSNEVEKGIKWCVGRILELEQRIETINKRIEHIYTVVNNIDDKTKRW